MDRRMLAIGVAAVALCATACGDSDNPTDRAIQAPDIEVEATAEAADAPPNSGRIGEDGKVSPGSDAAQGNATCNYCRLDGKQPQSASRSDAAQIVPKREMP